MRLTSPVTIDGVLNDAVWQGPPAVTRLTQSDPIEGATPSESTWVWVAYDENALYVAARCWDSRPDSIIARLVRRDVSTNSDRFFLYLDPFHDGRSGFYFGINVVGVLYDGTLFNDIASDDSWDGVWEGRARRDGGARDEAPAAGGSGSGWTAEMRIPFSQLRYRPGSGQAWSVNFKRCIERRSEIDYLVYRPKNGGGFVSRFPDLVGLEIGRRPRSVEVLPYVTGKSEYLVHQIGDPFNDGSRHTPGTGADLRASVGNNLTLNATANPDFGQVEVDPAVVNLSDVETYYQEKRPFFTENSSIFHFGNEGASNYSNLNWPEPQFFYSRRIGRAPQVAVPDDADFSDVPVATHILGAAKLTGKLGPAWNFGTLHALTSREDAKYQVDGLGSQMEVEPLTYYGVARGLKEFRERRHGLGLMTTLVQRRFAGDGLGGALNRQSLMTGLDGWHFLDPKKVWVVSGWAVMSRLAGSQERMIDVQRNSLHYLQRPDAQHLGVDSSATSLTGYGTRLWLNKEEGHVLFNSALGVVSPRFDVNDMGIHSRTDVINGHVAAGYRWPAPTSWRRYAEVAAAVFQNNDFDGNRTWAGTYASANVNFANNWSLYADAAWNPETVNDRRTRGGPLSLNRPGYQVDGGVATDSRRVLSYSFDFSTYTVPATTSFTVGVWPGVQWNPVSNFSMSVGPGLERNVDDVQYLTQVSDPGHVPADFGGQRYVFGRLDQTTVSANIRLDVSFTPNLSLRTFIQPLISAGRYADFKELARAGSYDFIHYGVDDGSTFDPASGTVDPDGTGPAPAFVLDDPNFNFKSLRGNAVLRWEYRPGSALFLVWTQQRTDEQDFGDLQLRSSLSRLVDARANDIFMVKLTYYLGL